MSRCYCVLHSSGAEVDGRSVGRISIDWRFSGKPLGCGYGFVELGLEEGMAVHRRCSLGRNGRIPMDGADAEWRDDSGDPGSHLWTAGIRVCSLPLQPLGVEVQ